MTMFYYCTPEKSSENISFPDENPERGPLSFGMGLYLFRLPKEARLHEQLSDMALEAGVGWVREQFTWDTIEYAPGCYDERSLLFHDAMVSRLQARGFNIVGLIAYQNNWSSGNVSPHSSEHYEDFARFVAFLVHRYRGIISNWEIWNEPNSARFWKPQPDAGRYCQLLQQAYRAAKEIDPRCTIIGGAIAGIDLSYLSWFFLAGGAQWMDVLSIHPYSSPCPWETSNVPSQLGVLQEMMNTMQIDVPLWVTEVGYPTRGENSIQPEEQAYLLVRTYLSLFAAGIQRVFWYEFCDNGPDLANALQNMGLVTNDQVETPFSPKPAYFALKTMTGILNGSTIQGRLDLGHDCWGLLFTLVAKDQSALVLWSTSNSGDGVSEIPLSGKVTNVKDIFGAPYPFIYESEQLRVNLKESPIYVIGNFRYRTLNLNTGFKSEQ